MEMKDQVGTCDLTMKSNPREGRDPSGNEGSGRNLTENYDNEVATNGSYVLTIYNRVLFDNLTI